MRVSGAVAVLIAVVTIMILASALGAASYSSSEKVPMIALESISLGNNPFGTMETFHISKGDSYVHRTSSLLNLSFVTNLVSPINDSLSLNDSIHLSKNPISVNFPLKNGTYSLSVPSMKSYLNNVKVEGNTSFAYITINEAVPTSDILLNGTFINGTQLIQNASIYNLTLDYGNSSFYLQSPGFVNVGNSVFQVFLSVDTHWGANSTLLRFSFPIIDGAFSFTYNQVVSSGQPIINDVLGQLQVGGFSSYLTQNLRSNAISLGIGGAIFAVIMVGMFAYYKRK